MSSASFRMDQARGEVRAIEIITTVTGVWTIASVSDMTAVDGDRYRAYPSDEYENATGMICVNGNTSYQVAIAARGER